MCGDWIETRKSDSRLLTRVVQLRRKCIITVFRTSGNTLLAFQKNLRLLVPSLRYWNGRAQNVERMFVDVGEDGEDMVGSAKSEHHRKVVICRLGCPFVVTADWLYKSSYRLIWISTLHFQSFCIGECVIAASNPETRQIDPAPTVGIEFLLERHDQFRQRDLGCLWTSEQETEARWTSRSHFLSLGLRCHYSRLALSHGSPHETATLDG